MTYVHGHFHVISVGLLPMTTKSKAGAKSWSSTTIVYSTKISFRNLQSSKKFSPKELSDPLFTAAGVLLFYEFVRQPYYYYRLWQIKMSFVGLAGCDRTFKPCSLKIGRLVQMMKRNIHAPIERT
jgi:hypothetical protein